MDPERRRTTTSELFICFTSRHTDNPEPHNCGPMFTPKAKKKGGASDNPEPSSPKVTCIGQVRVKTKKQGKRLRSRSNRRGEANFRHGSVAAPQGLGRSFSRTHFNQQRNQRWVHLPVTICEALRSFGAELNCLLPCRSSCMSKPAGSGESTSCGAVFVRWLVASQDGDGKGREIELMVAEQDPPEICRSRRRHVFEDINIDAEGFEKKTNACVPPKNALLLMRCRSDPVKMATLSNHFFHKNEEEDDEEMPRRVQLETEHSTNVEEEECGVRELKARDWVTQETHQEQYPGPESEKDRNNLTVDELNLENQETELVAKPNDLTDSSPSQFLLETQNQEIEDTTESESESESESEEDGSEEEELETEAEALAEMAEAVVTEEEELEEGGTEASTRERSEPEEAGPKSTEESQNHKALPDCLMLMMYEPKLSMEVSKETWVCTTDFVRWLPERPPVIKTDVQDEPMKRIGTDSSAAQPQPPRSSCSFPEPAPATCEPSVLTRCKSEPKRPAAKPDGTRTMRSAFNEVSERMVEEHVVNKPIC